MTQLLFDVQAYHDSLLRLPGASYVSGFFLAKDHYMKLLHQVSQRLSVDLSSPHSEYSRKNYCYMQMSKQKDKLLFGVGRKGTLTLDGVYHNPAEGIVAVRAVLKKNYTDISVPHLVLAAKEYAQLNVDDSSTAFVPFSSAYQVAGRIGILMTRRVKVNVQPRSQPILSVEANSDKLVKVGKFGEFVTKKDLGEEFAEELCNEGNFISSKLPLFVNDHPLYVNTQTCDSYYRQRSGKRVYTKYKPEGKQSRMIREYFAKKLAAYERLYGPLP